jgi:hypothetical protein
MEHAPASLEASMEELMGDQGAESSRSVPTGVVSTLRDSSISVSAFNRFIVGEMARKTGDEGRHSMDNLRKQRQHASESHRQYGASLGAASRAQMQRDKQQYDALREANLLKGMTVRDDIASQNSERARLRSEWVEYGRRLADRDAEQRRRIKDVCGEGSKRVQEMVAQAKWEEEEFERELTERRAQILYENQEEVKRIKAETANTVTDASKQYALDRRKNVAAGTKESVKLWGKERGKNTDQHLKSALNNRADIEQTRQNTKKLRQKLLEQRQKEAAAARDLVKKNKQARDDALRAAKQDAQAVHDGIYRAKYVPSDSADYLMQSKYGRSTISVTV